MTSSNASNKIRYSTGRGPVRKLPSPMALEQRLMFDGAGAGDFVAVVEKLPTDLAVQREVQTARSISELVQTIPAASGSMLRIPISALDASSVLAQASLQAQAQLNDFLQRSDVREQLFALFNGGQKEASLSWQQAANTLLSELERGSYSIQVQLLSGAEMKDALGAFTAQGPNGSAVIFVNADWLKQCSDSTSVSRVLLEEIGHSLDAMLNPNSDSSGDEGEAFAALASGKVFTQAETDRIAIENDHSVIWIDGKAFEVENAAPAIGTRTQTLTNDYSLVTSTDRGFTVTAQNASGAATIFVRSAGSPTGFGVAGGNNEEVEPGELIILNLDYPVSSATVNFSWMAASEHASYTLYLDGVLVQSAVTVTGQTDNIDPPVTLSASNGSRFNRVVFGAPGGGDDYLINQITYLVISTVTASEDTSFAFTGLNTLSVSDSDGNVSSTSLSVNNGTLNVTLTGGASLSAGANGTASLTISGSQTAINDTLATLTYQGVLNFNGSDRMTVVATDSTGSTDTARVPITVTPVNDAPVSQDNTYSALARATSAAPLMTGKNLITNTDFTAGTDRDLETTTSALRIARINGVTFAANGTDAAHLAANGWMQVALTQGVLFVKIDGTIEFSPTVGAHGVDTADTFTYAVTDGSLSSGNSTVQLNIRPSSTPTLSVSTVTVSEASAYLVFQVGVDYVSSTAISFMPTLSSGTATVGTDTGASSALQYFNVIGSSWVSASSGVTLAAGSSAVLLRTAIVNDTVYEGADTFTLSTGAITGTVTNVGPASGTGTIKDDGNSTNVFDSSNNTAASTVGSSNNDKPTVSISSVTVSEASDYAVFSASLSNTSDSAISFTPSLANGSATVGIDTGASDDLQFFNGANWVLASTGVTISAGSTSVLLRTAINNETTYEGPETFTVSTGNITGTVINTNPATGIGTIKDDGSNSNVFATGNNTATATAGTADNDKPTISISSVTISEASEYAVFSVSLSNASASAISFTPSQINGTATAGTDTGANNALQYYNGATWVSASSGISISAGTTNVLVRTAIVNDTTYEGSETFTLSTGSITGTVTNTGAATGTGTIKDDGSSTNVFLVSNNTATPTVGDANDDKPTASINDVTVSESSAYVVFSVSLNNATASAITFTPSITNGTATVGTDTGANNALQYFKDSSWVSASSGVTLAANTTSVLVRTAIVNDTIYEVSETFTLSTGIFTGTLTSTAALTATGTIKDDGSSTNVFLITNNTATPSVGVANDDKPTVSVNSVTVSESSDYAVFSVSMSNASTAAVSFIPTLTNGTGTVGTDTGAIADLQFFNGTAWASATTGVSIAAGSTNVLVRTAIVNDNTYEGPETFTLSTGAITGTVTNTGAATGTGTITDDGSSANVFLATNNTATPSIGIANEDRPTVTISSVTVSEASDFAVFTVSMSYASTGAVSFTPSLTSGTALAGTDTGNSAALEYLNGANWVAVTGGVTISPGNTNVLVRTVIVNDTTYEGSETFTLSTGAITGTVANTGAATGTGTIKDDGTTANVFAAANNTATPTAGTANDDKPTVSVNDVTVSEASNYAVFLVSLTNPSASDISFIPSLTNGTATAGTDTGTNAALEFFNGTNWVSAAAGATLTANTTSVLVRTVIVNDTIYEGSETFTLSTGSFTGTVANTAAATGSGTIKDDSSSTNVFAANNNTATPTVGAANEDRPTVSVNNVTVSEASPFAVFSVSLTNTSTSAISFIPTLSSGTATVGTDTGANGDLQYFNGATWESASTGVTIAAGSSNLILRTAIVNDNIFEVSESFTLSTGTITGTVTNTGAASGTATIKDDGSSNNVFSSTNNTSTPTAGGTNQDLPTLSVSNVTVSEASPYAVFTISLTNASTAAISFMPSLTSVTGTVGTDTGTSGELQYYDGAVWAAAAGGVTIAANSTSVLLRTSIVNDTTYEISETFTLSSGIITGSVTNAGPATGTGTIKDDGSSTDVFNASNISATPTVGGANDDKPTVAVSSVTVSEASPYAVFSVSLTNASTAAISFVPSITSGTATVGTDTGANGDLQFFNGAAWVSASTGLTVAAGSTNVLLRTTIVDDNSFEGPESLTLSTGSITGTVTNTAAATGTGTIKDDGSSTNIFAITNNTATPTVGASDNDKPTMSIAVNAASMSEDAVGVMTYTLTLSKASAFSTTVNYTFGGTATSGIDYTTSGTGTLTIPAGQLTATFTVDPSPDALFEFNESVIATVSSASTLGQSLILTTSSATGTIINDDASPYFSISSASANEGDLVSFTVRRTGDAQPTQTVSFATSSSGGGTASENDLSAISGTLSFGSGETAKTFTVQTTADVLFEADETFNVQLSNATDGAAIDTASATGTIVNDDAAPLFSIANASANEGESIRFTVLRVGDAQETQLVNYATSIGADNTTSADDFIAASGTLSFTTGQTSQTFNVQSSVDSMVEADETFTVTINYPTGIANSGIKTATATGKVINTDLAISNPILNEASPYAVFTVKGSAGQQVKLGLVGESATGGGVDFGATGPTNLQVSLDSGSSWSNYVDTVGMPASALILVRTPVIDDLISDNSETFKLTGSSAGGLAKTGVATLKDDGTGEVYAANGSLNVSGRRTDDRELSVNSISVNEASAFAVFRVSGAAGQLASLALSDGTASSSDFGSAMEVSTDGGVTWLSYASDSTALNASGTLLVRTPVKQDSVSEGAETFKLAATNSGGSTGSGTATIRDDGTGILFKNDGSDENTAVRDDDRAMSVSAISVNEASPYAVFRISGAAGQLARLVLADGTANSADYGSALQISSDGGANWVSYAGGNTTLNANGALILRTPVKQDSLNEGAETFTLAATNMGGTAGTGTATIRDDGAGSVFKNDGNDDSVAVRDDDRPLSINSVSVSEASPYAVFEIQGATGQLVRLALKSGSATVGVDIGNAIETFNGSSWQAYNSAVSMPGASILVRVAVIDDSLFEGLESFTLEATNGGGAVFSGTATIADDSSIPDVFLVDNNTAKPSIGRADDDQPKPPPVQSEPMQTPSGSSTLSAPPVMAQVPLLRAGSSMADSSVWVPDVINPKAIAPPVEVPTLVMAERIPDQFADRNSNASFAVPDRTFMVSTPGQQLSLTAEQADGTPLPSWLNFNSNTRRFEGQPPPDFVGELKLKVTARDGQGGEAEAQFRFQIGNPETPATPDSPTPNAPVAPVNTQGRNSLQQQLRDLAQPRRGDLTRIHTARTAVPVALTRG